MTGEKSATADKKDEETRSFPYWPVVTHRLLRRVLPGIGVSALGDGMALVAISWLALQVAPENHRATWVALAVAAYELPAIFGAIVLGRFLAGRGSAQLVCWDAALRGAALGLIPISYYLGLLSAPLLVALLATSSLMHSWGNAGQFALIAQALPQRLHVPANAILTVFTEASTIVGPPLAGLLIAAAGAPIVIAADAVSFFVLSISFAAVIRRGLTDQPAAVSKRRSTGLRLIARDRTMVGLIALTFLFFLLFGPVYVALPVHVTNDLHGSAALLGLYYSAFGIGSLVGALATGYAGNLPLWRTTIAIVIGFGATLLPIGLGAPTPVSLIFFVVGGFIWAPYMATSRALFQRRATPETLPSILAANNALIVGAVPLGTMTGGLVAGRIGAQHTMLAVALCTMALGLVAAIVIKVFPNSRTEPSAPPTTADPGTSPRRRARR